MWQLRNLRPSLQKKHAWKQFQSTLKKSFESLVCGVMWFISMWVPSNSRQLCLSVTWFISCCKAQSLSGASNELHFVCLLMSSYKNRSRIMCRGNFMYLNLMETQTWTKLSFIYWCARETQMGTVWTHLFTSRPGDESSWINPVRKCSIKAFNLKVVETLTEKCPWARESCYLVRSINRVMGLENLKSCF